MNRSLSCRKEGKVRERYIPGCRGLWKGVVYLGNREVGLPKVLSVLMAGEPRVGRRWKREMYGKGGWADPGHLLSYPQESRLTRARALGDTQGFKQGNNILQYLCRVLIHCWGIGSMVALEANMASLLNTVLLPGMQATELSTDM